MPQITTARLATQGQPLELVTVDKPVPGPKEVLVKVEASSLVPNASNIVSGSVEEGPELPCFFGLDASGVIEAIGPHVVGLNVGNKKLCHNSCLRSYITLNPGGKEQHKRYPLGALSECILSPDTNIAVLPSSIDINTACRFGYIGTSFGGLKKADIGPGKTLLINGVTGTLGYAAVAIGLGLGCTKILGVGRNKERLAQIQSLCKNGRVAVRSSEDGDFADWVRDEINGLGVDALYDCLGAGGDAESTSQLLECVKAGGKMILAGGATEGKIEFTYRTAMVRDVAILGTVWFDSAEIDEMIDLIDAGVIDLSFLQHKFFSLSDVNKALEFVGSRPGGAEMRKQSLKGQSTFSPTFAILKAVELCGNGGTITLPAPYTYTISSRLYMRLTRARLNVHGLLSFTPDLGYWIENSHRVEFQNMSTAWIMEGDDFIVDGGGWQQGGINGNGQAWYGRAAGQSNQYERPISLSIFNSTNVSINDFAFYQPQFWSVWAQDSRNITMTNIYINGINTDPAGNSSNYAINVDGIDTMRVDQMRLENWTFQGGDDCFAPKGNSTNMVLRNFTCIGGGIAFGSVGQYPGHPDFIINISVSDIRVSQKFDAKYGGAAVAAGAYFKSWVGVEMGNPPQGGGGGTGRVSNVTFHNLIVENTSQAVYINKCYFKVPAQGAYCETSTFEFQDFDFDNISGTVRTPIGVNLNCSQAAPCRDLKLSEVSLRQSESNKTAITVFENAQNVFGVSEGNPMYSS
ncbi:pectin lyase-like protein [Aureobasidium pullulans]|nr:pectin lyase-like protein [Aureobasidium pullulans]